MQTEIILRPKKSKQFFLLLVCSVFVLIGAWMIADGDVLGWLVLLFFGLCEVVTAISLLPNASYLKLDSTGLRTKSLLGETWCPWYGIEHFKIVEIPNTRLRVVGFAYRPTYSPAKKVNTMNRAVTECDEVLPDVYGDSVEALLALLQEWHLEYGSR